MKIQLPNNKEESTDKVLKVGPGDGTSAESVAVSKSVVEPETDEEKVPQGAIKKINSRHRDIMRRLILGERQCDIAREIGMTESRVSVVVNSPLFRKELAMMQAQLDERIIAEKTDVETTLKIAAPDAVEVLKELMMNKRMPPHVRRQSAKDILDHSHGKSSKAAQEAAASGANFPAIIEKAFDIARKEREAARKVIREEMDRGAIEVEAQAI